MTRKTCVDKNGMKKGAWSEEEDDKLRTYILRYGHWNWRLLPKFAGLARCGKSCRLRWMNYLKPGLKRGSFTKEEEHLIAKLHDELGKKWSAIAARIPGRSDNEIKNFWHTHLKKRSSKTNIIPSSSEITVCKNNASNSDEGRREFSENFHQIETTSDKHMIQVGSSGTLKTPTPGGVIWDSEDTASSSLHSAGRQVEETHHMLSQEQLIAQNFDSTSLIDGMSLSDGFEASFWTEPFMVDTSYSQDHSFSPLMLMVMEEQLNKTHQFALPWM